MLNLKSYPVADSNFAKVRTKWETFELGVDYVQPKAVCRIFEILMSKLVDALS